MVIVLCNYRINHEYKSSPSGMYWFIFSWDMAQWSERGALPMSLPAVRFRIPLGEEFSETYHVSPLSILGHFYVVPLDKALHP